MPLKIPPVPDNTKRALESGLGDFLTAGCDLWYRLLHNYQAHAVHNLMLSAVQGWKQKDPPPLATATKPTGWRFLAACGSQVGGCHVGPEDTAAAALPQLTGFSNANAINGVLEAIDQLQQSREVKNGSYELRVLRIPWLQRELFWLRADNEDLVVPYSGFVQDYAGKLKIMPWAVYWSEIAGDVQNVPQSSPLLSHSEKGAGRRA